MAFPSHFVEVALELIGRSRPAFDSQKLGALGSNMTVHKAARKSAPQNGQEKEQRIQLNPGDPHENAEGKGNLSLK